MCSDNWYGLTLVSTWMSSWQHNYTAIGILVKHKREFPLQGGGVQVVRKIINVSNYDILFGKEKETPIVTIHGTEPL